MSILIRVLFPAPVRTSGLEHIHEILIVSWCHMLTRLSNHRHKLRINVRRPVGHELGHDRSEAAIVIEHGLARRLAAEAEPGSVLVFQQLKGMLGLGPCWFENLTEGVNHGWVCLLMRLPIPVDSSASGFFNLQRRLCDCNELTIQRPLGHAEPILANTSHRRRGCCTATDQHLMLKYLPMRHWTLPECR